MRKWVVRIGLGVAVAVVAAGAWAWANRAGLEVKYAAYRLRSATTDDDRATWGGRLAATDAGREVLVGLVPAGEAPTRAAALAALDRYLAEQPDGDPAAGSVCDGLLDTFPSCDDAGKVAVLDLLPAVLKRVGAWQSAKCRAVVAAGLAMPAVECRLAAVRAALHPAVGMRADLLPLLSAPEPEVRRAALFAVGPASDDPPVIDDEELCRWLHDPDDGVRRVCLDALVSRGRTDGEIAHGRRLADPLAAERLKLLADLRYDDEVPDPEPWLERLSRDADPGVRAGAARVMVEVAADRGREVPGWVRRLADADPEPAVRRVAEHYRSRAVGRRDAGVRPSGGP
ncbi:MAG: hypothetical protein K2X87_20220 [Gemmataceae bacterium]|nr:hypothetical protein [Gemmataceae bacterium]